MIVNPKDEYQRTHLWGSDGEPDSEFEVHEKTADESLWLVANSEYAVDLDFHQATALRDALDGWLMRHARMA